MVKTVTTDLNVEIRQLQAKLSRVTKQYNVLEKEIVQTKSAQQQFAQQGATGLNKLNKIAGALGLTLGAAFVTSKVTSFLREATKLAGLAQGIRQAFDRLNDPKLLDDLRRATRNTTSDMDLMRQAVRAENFKIPLEKLATFFQFATERAAQTGESVDYLVNSIIDGIGRKSTLVMDNLGISAVELQQEIKLTGDFGKAAANIIEREMAKAGDVMLTAAQIADQQKASIENLQEEIGTKMIPIQKLYNEVVLDYVNKISNAIDLIDVFFMSQEEIVEKYNFTASSVKDILASVGIVQKEVNKEAKEQVRNYAFLTEQLNFYNAQLKDVDASEADNIETAKTIIKLTEERNRLIGKVTKETKETKKETDKFTDSISTLDGRVSTFLSNNEEEWADLFLLLQTGFKESTEASTEFAKGVEGNLNFTSKALKAQGEDDQKSLDERAKQIEFWVNEVSSAISNVFLNLFQKQSNLVEQQRQIEIQAVNDSVASEESKAEQITAINKKFAEEQKKIAIKQATIDFAAGIIEIWSRVATLTPIGAAALSALLAGQFAANLALINSQSFAEGGFTGLGEHKDHTGERVAGIVHEKEFVIDRQKTAKYRPLLDAIHEDRLQSYLDANGLVKAAKKYEDNKNIGFAQNIANSLLMNKEMEGVEGLLFRLNQKENKTHVFLKAISEHITGKKHETL